MLPKPNSVEAALPDNFAADPEAANASSNVENDADFSIVEANYAKKSYWSDNRNKYLVLLVLAVLVLITLSSGSVAASRYVNSNMAAKAAKAAIDDSDCSKAPSPSKAPGKKGSKAPSTSKAPGKKGSKAPSTSKAPGKKGSKAPSTSKAPTACSKAGKAKTSKA